jgi:hypothetical protein
LAVTEARVTHRKAVADETINVVQVFAVPRGGSLDINSGTITIDGGPAEPMPLEPFTPTPAIAIADQSVASDLLPQRLEVHEGEADNVTRSDTVRHKRDEPDESGSA